ncbi:MAG TPA: VCBS repeat-containing protein, partial [Chitinophagales bacterium]|nr:VCBS repeat-containing protein [Chitinophagales bacterium]
HAVFLDFNKDNFLDIYINANFNSKLQSHALQSVSDWEPEDYYPDYLFQNHDGKRFENVIKTSGITFDTKYRYGFTPYASDFNNDGWVDLYLCNDYDIPDHLYYNDRRGKFFEADDDVMPQTCFYTMGIDVADINNDGLNDMVAVDMRSDKNYRQKTSWWETPYDWNRLLTEKHKRLQKQQVKNVLQLNRGDGTYSQISELAGIDATEWSWSPLIADFDNDGLKDIFISNGNSIDRAFFIDLALEVDSIKRANPNFSTNDYLNYIKTPADNPWFINYIYKNNGDLTFKDMRQEWGMGKSEISTGAAYADFDNDGDLDIVVNNNGSLSFIYENLLNTQKENNWLRIRFVDERHQPVQGSSATVFIGKAKQFSELQPVKGFLSQSENILHFGTGENKMVDSLLIKWCDGKIQLLKDVACNQVLKVYHGNARQSRNPPVIPATVFQRIHGIGLDYKHQEDDFIDFGIDPLLPQMFSKEGPALASGDLNGDGLNDVLVGGSVNKPRACFLQNKNRTFTRALNTITSDTKFEDGALMIFDADNDGDNDVYVATGGYEFPDSSENLQHRLYVNNGKGNFIRSKDALPFIATSSKCAAAADYDKDGYPDLFVGGRVKSQKYPLMPRSYLLKNDEGKFKDVTESVAPELRFAGMITDAVWSDFDNDKQLDLILVGEYMPVTFFKNNNGRFVNVTSQMITEQKTNGFWNCITQGDFDNDGDMDYVLGNLGLNTRFKAKQNAPLELFASDFDENGSLDVISCFNEDGKVYPCKQLRTLTPRINGLAKKFYKTEHYGRATIGDMFNLFQLSKAIHLFAFETATCYLQNNGGTSFTLTPLSLEAQFAPVNDILADDVNHDGNLDLLLVGNFYYAEVERGRYDSFKGLYLTGNGKGNFTPLSLTESGFVVDGDARGIIKITQGKGTLYISSQNSDSLITYSVFSSSL